MLFAVSVTTKRTSTPSRFTLPFSTMPPILNVRPVGASFAATCEGVKKNTRFSWNAVSTSAVATPSATRPTRIAAMRLCLGFTRAFRQKHDFQEKQEKRYPIGAPYVPRIAAHGEKVAHDPRSRMMQRTRTSDTAMAYIQKASAMTSIPVSMVAAIFGAAVRLTEAPWWSVFHHCTE